MTEQFLHFIWEHRLFESDCLYTIDGEPVSVEYPGLRNRDAGPDFSHARIRLGDTLWVGNVEIHKAASEWYRHGHDADAAYQNIILHVVVNADRTVLRPTGEEIPTLELPFRSELLNTYEKLQTANSWIACAESFHRLEPFQLEIGYSRLMTERLEQKTAETARMLNETGADWDETFYRLLARNFGFHVNALPFELLAKSLPFRLVARHSDTPFQVEALLFGQSGLLHDSLLGDDYYMELREEYRFLADKYQLRPLSGHLWKFLRLRPVNFPTLRLAQFAQLLVKSPQLFSRFTQVEELREIKELLEAEATGYWLNHYRFNVSAIKKVKRLGHGSIDNIIVNTLVPLLFLYGERHQKPFLQERALNWLMGISPEENGVIRRWRELGAHARSMFDSQALLQLKREYCDKRRCLECHVGYRIFKKA